jgi:hypothetical protein
VLLLFVLVLVLVFAVVVMLFVMVKVMLYKSDRIVIMREMLMPVNDGE